MVKVPDQPNQPRLICVEGEQCRSRGCPRDCHSERADDVEFVFIHLALYLDVVSVDFLHIR